MRLDCNKRELAIEGVLFFSCALSAVQIEPRVHYHGEAVDCMQNPMGDFEGGDKKGGGGGVVKGRVNQSKVLVNFPEGRLRAWLERPQRGCGDGPIKR